MKKYNLILSSSILLGCILLGIFIYASQTSKQKSIEKQQQIELQVKTEQNNRDYIAKRKTECLAIYKTESAKFNNVDSWHYNEPQEPKEKPQSDVDNPFWDILKPETSDTCEIIYKYDKGESFSKYF